jgi:cell division protein ZapE
MPHKTTHKTKILFKQYEQLILEGKIKNDAAQREVLQFLHNTIDSLSIPKKISLLRKREKKSQNLYIWGEVGRGKSMLMDLFFAAAPVTKKRRIHFHAFMQEDHARIHEIRKKNQNVGGISDPIALLAKQIAEETSLLCFDELQATDVADASILYRLFEGLFAQNICIISTSNRPPEKLYTGGVQAERFNNFITLIKEKMQVTTLPSPDDYRYLQAQNFDKNYYYPLDANADIFIAEKLKKFAAKTPVTMEILHIHGREIGVKTYGGEIGFFSFAELCENPLGAADYLAIASKFPIIFLTGIPTLTPEKRNEAKRFVTLIDALYEHKNKLIITAAIPPEKIYEHGDGAFEFHRTVSRLTEMSNAIH